MNILANKYYSEGSVFKPENLLREAKRQKDLPDGNVPATCLLDPDGDLANYLINTKRATLNEYWACYHSKMYTFTLDGFEIGIVPCIVGSSYAVLVAEQLFVSGCKILISITSAGIICPSTNNKKFALITSAIRDEGTSYHYLPPEHEALINQDLLSLFNSENDHCPYFKGISWTTDAPFRETYSAVEEMRKRKVTCVEMEAAALYALSIVKQYKIVCFAHLTNSMAQTEGDFEKGEEFGSVDTLNLVSYVLRLVL